MRKIKIKSWILIVIMAAAVCLATLPTYKSLSGFGNASTACEVDFPADPTSQIRVIGVNYTSDTNNGTLTFTTGVGAYVCTTTNLTTTFTTQTVNTVFGIPASATMCLQHAGSLYFNTVSSTNLGTNLVLSSGGWGVSSSVGDEVFVMGNSTAISVGAVTNWQNGEGIYIGNYGRPVRVQLSTALVTNRLNPVTVHYDAASQ